MKVLGTKLSFSVIYAFLPSDPSCQPLKQRFIEHLAIPDTVLGVSNAKKRQADMVPFPQSISLTLGSVQDTKR